MKYKNIKGTDIDVSEVCLGTANYGGSTDEKTSFELMDAFVKRGGNFLDTAHIYNDWIPGEKARSEKTIGKWLELNGNRKDVIISTKCAHPSFDTPNKPRLSSKYIITDHDESLEYLKTNQIDILWLHRDDINICIEEIIDTLQNFKEKGTIRYYACSNWTVERIKEANYYAEKKYGQGFIANQIRWSLAKVNLESIKDIDLVTMTQDDIEFHKRSRMCVTPYTSLANGFFYKLNKFGLDDLSDSLKRQYLNEYNINILSKVVSLSKKYGVSENAISLAYLTSQKDFTTIPIVSFKNTIQLEDALDVEKVELDMETIKWLEENRFD